MLPNVIADGLIVRSVYLSGDNELIELFERLLPRPPASLFPEDRIPESIKKRELEAAETIQNVIERNDGDIKKVEVAATKIQRAFRGKKRRKEEPELIKNAHKEELKWIAKDRRKAEGRKVTLNEVTNQFIENANVNTPYRPKCDDYPELADRLLEAAKNIEPFTTVRHLTATKSVPNILDDGLMGRKSLLRKYKAFRTAALHPNDRINGDADVICFGAFELDPKCMRKNTT